MTDKERIEGIKNRIDPNKWRDGLHLNIKEEIEWLIEQAEIAELFSKKIVELNKFLQGVSSPKNLGRNVIDVAMEMIREQAERTQKLVEAHELKDREHIGLVQQLKEKDIENNRLRQALEFYADEDNYIITGEKTYIGHGDFLEETWIEVDKDNGKKSPSSIGGIGMKNLKEILGLESVQDYSDGFHTFEELYYHRMVLFSVICAYNKDKSYKSLLHDDGTMFEDYFIVGIETIAGQYSYHYHIKHWDLFDVKTLPKAPKWDGHNPSDIERLFSLLKK